ncbi:hypothetical protein [Sphingomonas sp.]|uniref:hypothetical protein n=1 Tax=Sphingomonas sp. TaxID=28214 RepID=UPI001B2C58B0|nr:hypothetical protein [Sphingomonas sp.]MBO9712517.1 hypothetical protein [Sphingomonas sp.]
MGAEELAELLIALDLLAMAAMFWSLVLRRWRATAGAALILAGSWPLLHLALAGELRLGPLLLLAAALLGGGALLVADFAGERRGRG